MNKGPNDGASHTTRCIAVNTCRCATEEMGYDPWNNNGCSCEDHDDQTNDPTDKTG